MAQNNLERKLELAIQAVISAGYDLIPGHVGHSVDDLVRPHFTVHVRTSKEIIYNSGTLLCTVEINVKSDADATTSTGAPIDHYERQGAIYDLILTSPASQFILALNQSGIEEFTAFVAKEMNRQESIDERAFVSTLTLDIICAGSVIS